MVRVCAVSSLLSIEFRFRLSSLITLLILLAGVQVRSWRRGLIIQGQVLTRAAAFTWRPGPLGTFSLSG